MKHRIYIWVLMGILIITSCAPKTSIQYSDKAERKLNRLNRGIDIESLLFKSLELDSTNHRAYVLLAMNVEFENGRTAHYETQRGYYKDALELDSLNANYWLYYGQTFEALALQTLPNGQDTISMSNISEAVSAFSKGIELDSTDYDMLIKRGRLYGLMQDYHLSLIDYTRAAELGSMEAKNMVKYLTGKK